MATSLNPVFYPRTTVLGYLAHLSQPCVLPKNYCIRLPSSPLSTLCFTQELLYWATIPTSLNPVFYPRTTVLGYHGYLSQPCVLPKNYCIGLPYPPLSTLCFTQELLYWVTITTSLNPVFYPRTTVLGYHRHLSQPCVLPKNYCIGLPWPSLSTLCFTQELLYWATIPTSLNPVFYPRTTVLGYHTHLSQPCVLPKNYCIGLPSPPLSTLCFTQELLYWATMAISLNHVFYPRTTVLGYHRHLSQPCVLPKNYYIGLPSPPLNHVFYLRTTVLGYHGHLSQPCVLPKNNCIGLPCPPLSTLCFTQELLYWATLPTSLNSVFYPRTTVLGYNRHLSQPCVLPKNYCIGLPYPPLNSVFYPRTTVLGYHGHLSQPCVLPTNNCFGLPFPPLSTLCFTQELLYWATIPTSQLCVLPKNYCIGLPYPSLSTMCFTQELLYWVTMATSLNHLFYPRTTVLGYLAHLSQPCVLPKNYCIGLPYPSLLTLCFPQELLYWATIPTSQLCVLPKNYCIGLPSPPLSTLCFTQELLYWVTIATSLNSVFYPRTTVLGYHRHLSQPCVLPKNYCIGLPSPPLNSVFYPRTTVLGYHGNLSQPSVLPKNYCIRLPSSPLSTLCFTQELLYWATMATSLNPVFYPRTTVLGYHGHLSQPCVLPKNYCIRLPSSPLSTLCFTQELLYWATIATSQLCVLPKNYCIGLPYPPLNSVFYPRTTVLGYHRHFS